MRLIGHHVRSLLIMSFSCTDVYLKFFLHSVQYQSPSSTTSSCKVVPLNRTVKVITPNHGSIILKCFLLQNSSLLVQRGVDMVAIALDSGIIHILCEPFPSNSGITAVCKISQSSSLLM